MQELQELRDMSELNFFLNLRDLADVDGVELLIFPVGTRAAGLPKNCAARTHPYSWGLSFSPFWAPPPKKTNSESDKTIVCYNCLEGRESDKQKMSAKIVLKTGNLTK